MKRAAAAVREAAANQGPSSGRPHATAVTLLSFPPHRITAQGDEGHLLRLMADLSEGLGPVLFVRAQGSVITDSI